MRRVIAPTPANTRQRRKLKDSATAPLTWAQRLNPVFEIDITLCPRCGGMLRVIGDVTDPDLIRKILDHVNSRAPPRLPVGVSRTPVELLENCRYLARHAVETDQLQRYRRLMGEAETDERKNILKEVVEDLENRARHRR